MVRACLLFFLAAPLAHSADELAKPEKISIHTWVREEMFAGWISNDVPALERGVAKLDLYLKDPPPDRNALSWKCLEASYRMLQARARHDDAAWNKQLAAAKELRARIFAGDVRDPG